MESHMESGHALPSFCPQEIARHYTNSSLVITHGDEKMMAFIMRKDMIPEMPFFAGRFRPGFITLYLSEDIPADFRPYLAWHESHCELRDFPGQENACLATLVSELMLVPEEIRDAYSAFRLQYYRNFLIGIEDFSNWERLRRPIGPYVAERTRECISYLEVLCAERANT